MKITIIGGGISGLSAAFELQNSGHDITLLEGTDRLGGKILTSEIEGFDIDAGPDSFLTRDPEMRELCFDLGLGEELVSPTGKPAKIWVGGEMHSLPKRHFLGVPLDLDELEELSLLTKEGAKRAKLDLNNLVENNRDVVSASRLRRMKQCKRKEEESRKDREEKGKKERCPKFTWKTVWSWDPLHILKGSLLKKNLSSS